MRPMATVPPFIFAMFLSVGGSAGVCSGELDRLERTLKLHESQQEKLSNVEISWTVRYLDPSGNQQSVEKFSTILSQFGEVTTSFRPNEKPIGVIWSGGRFVEISGYDPGAGLLSDFALVQLRASLFVDVKPIRRLFPWRSLRAYRFLATDRDMTFRELCKSSSFEPKVLDNGETLRVEVGHPGTEPHADKATPSIPRGTRVSIDFDKNHGNLVKRHETTFKSSGEDKPFTQILSVLQWEELSDGQYFPKKVRYAAEVGGNLVAEQLIQFDISKVEDQSSQKYFRLPANMMITSYGKEEPSVPNGTML